MYMDEIVESIKTFNLFILLSNSADFSDPHVVIYKGKKVFFYLKSNWRD